MVDYSKNETYTSSLYNIASKKAGFGCSSLSFGPLNLMFRRALIGDKLAKWNVLGAKVAFCAIR
jgi:hypothetical protein